MKVSNLSNSVWSIFDVLLYPAFYVLFTPFLISHLGKDSYGLFIMVNTIIVFMQIFNFGLGINTQKNVASAIGKSSFSNIPFIVSTNLSIAIGISGLCIVLSIVLAQCSYQFNWFELPDSLKLTALISISICGVVVAQKMIEQVLLNALNAFEKIGLTARYNSIVRLLNLFISLYLIRLNFNLALVFGATIIVYSIGLVFLYVFVIKSTGTFTIRLVPEWSYVKKEMQYSKWIWLQAIFVIMAFQFDKFLVAHWFGIGNFSYYSIVSTLFNHIHLALMAIVPWALPQIAKRVSMGTDVKHYYISFRSLIHIIAYLGILLFSLLHHQLFRLWLGNETLKEVDGYLHLFMIFELLLSLTIAPYFLLNAMGKEKLSTINTLIYASLSLVGLAAGYYLFHSIAAIISGTIIALILSMSIQQFMISRVLSVNILKEVLGILLPILSLAVFILSEGQTLLFRILVLSISLFFFVYTYFFQYPVRLFQLNSVKSDELSL